VCFGADRQRDSFACEKWAGNLISPTLSGLPRRHRSAGVALRSRGASALLWPPLFQLRHCHISSLPCSQVRRVHLVLKVFFLLSSSQVMTPPCVVWFSCPASSGPHVAGGRKTFSGVIANALSSIVPASSAHVVHQEGRHTPYRRCRSRPLPRPSKGHGPSCLPSRPLCARHNGPPPPIRTTQCIVLWLHADGRGPQNGLVKFQSPARRASRFCGFAGVTAFIHGLQSA